MWRSKTNPDAQTSLDFMIGVAIFLLVFIFVFAFIPRMLTPFQSNSDELTMTADRTAVAMMENLLVDNRHVDSSNQSIVVYQGASTPGIISRQKVQTLRDSLNPANPGNTIMQTKKYLGLGFSKSYTSAVPTLEQYYNIQVEFSTPDGIAPASVGLSPISFDGDPVGSNVGQSRRFVYVQGDAGDYTMAVMTVRVW